MGKTWTRDMEVKLLLAIIDSNKEKPAWKKIADHMGEGLTDESVR